MRKRFLTTTSNTNASLGLLILRLGVGGLMLTHGYPKLVRLLDGNMKFGDPLGIGSELAFILIIFAEFVCSILIMLGIYTRLASIPLIIGMMIAAFIHHSADPLNIKERALLYLVVFLCLLFTGSGKYAVDKKL
jgi:putative oxidoreductase